MNGRINLKKKTIKVSKQLVLVVAQYVLRVQNAL